MEKGEENIFSGRVKGELEISFEEQVRQYHELGKEIEALEERKKALSSSILSQMEGKKMKVGECTLCRYKRLSIKLSLEEARMIDAVKIEETIDRERIKSLFESDRSLHGVSEIEYLRVSSNPNIT